MLLPDRMTCTNIDRKVVWNNLRTFTCKKHLHNLTTRVQSPKKSCFQQEKHFQKKYSMKDREPSMLSLGS